MTDQSEIVKQPAINKKSGAGNNRITELSRYGQTTLTIIVLSAFMLATFVYITMAMSSGDSANPEISTPTITAGNQDNNKNYQNESNEFLQITSSATADELYSGYKADGYAAISAPSKALSLSFIARGIVAEIPVEESQVVEPGQILARLDDEVQSFSLQAQLITAEDMSEQLSAQQRLALAEFDLQNILEAEQLDAVAEREVERAKIDKSLREIELQAAISNHEKNQLLYKRDKAFFDDMTIKANFKGIVARLNVHEGEAVDELQSVVNLVVIDPLWMDVAVPIKLGMALEKGDQAVVYWRDLPGEPPSQGTVLWISPVNDASSNKIILRLEIQNPASIPAGLHAKVKFPETDYEISEDQP